VVVEGYEPMGIRGCELAAARAPPPMQRLTMLMRRATYASQGWVVW